MGGKSSKEKPSKEQAATEAAEKQADEEKEQTERAQQFHKLFIRYKQLSTQKAAKEDNKQAIEDRAKLRKNVGVIAEYVANALQKSESETESEDSD
jgi:hypothetical protein